MERKSNIFEFIDKLSAKNENVVFERPIECASDCRTINHNEDYVDIYEEVEDESQTKCLQNDESHIFNVHMGPKRRQMSSKLQAELSKYKQELLEYTNTTKDLDEKYLKINSELKEMQQKHDHFVAKRNRPCGDAESYSDTSGSEFSLQRKYTQVFHRGNSFMRVVPIGSQGIFEPRTTDNYEMNQSHRQSSENRHTGNITRCKRCPSESKENKPPPDYTKSREKNIRDIYRNHKTSIDVSSNQQIPKKVQDVDILQTTINNLQSEQDRFRTIIEQQQHCLQDYHTRCVKAKHIMKSQQIEIEKLNSNNQQLETEITAGVDQLRLKMESKLREVAHLPQMMRDEQTKNDRIVKDNGLLNDRIRSVQAEANQMKIKIDEIGRRKMATMARLKAAERDLKIFKNYNAALKHEKRKLNDELQKIREQMNSMQNSSKRTMNRQREQSEKLSRELQKRVYELEMKLSRSKNSATSLIQERDSLIAELQTQLNTLVHNFEVSQKHIRVLRRHIYSMSGGNARETVARNRVLVETA